MLVGKNKLDDDDDDAIVSANSIVCDHVWNVLKHISTPTASILKYWTLLLIHHFSFQSDLDNLTWQEIQRKMREVQLEQQMCIHKRDLTELDIYHRILRYHVV